MTITASVILYYFLIALGITFGILMGVALSICVGLLCFMLTVALIDKIFNHSHKRISWLVSVYFPSSGSSSVS